MAISHARLAARDGLVRPAPVLQRALDKLEMIGATRPIWERSDPRPIAHYPPPLSGARRKSESCD